MIVVQYITSLKFTGDKFIHYMSPPLGFGRPQPKFRGRSQPDHTVGILSGLVAGVPTLDLRGGQNWLGTCWGQHRTRFRATRIDS